MKGIDNKPGSPFKQEDWISFYQQPHWKKPGRESGRSRNYYRFAVALLIFMALLALKETHHPWGIEARENLKNALTSEWNYQPVVERVVQYGLQIANMDWPFFSTVQPVVTGPQKNSAAGMLPFPVSGKVIRGYGMTIDQIDNMERFHPGIDIAAPVGSAVRVVLDGKVKRLGDSPAFGRYVLLEHGQGSFTLYSGLSRVTVNDGQLVQAGQTIGEVGVSGDIPGGGLHFEMRENNKLIDPLIRLQPLNNE
ncbi:MAG: Murein hydrolase activator NlpD precursor [Pelotomaculum sp. PtaU1.Bin035]|nr:MAG: Murein hydrolase activator NlpD precursor [Pelotomaculum sp. PtaU1.Bin035]